MRIAQIAPLAESVPPKLYGGTERIVAYLTDELVAMGHDVTLFASGDSITTAELVPGSKMALRLHPDQINPMIYFYIMLERLLERADEFDIIHTHIDYLSFPSLRGVAHKCLHTLHGRQDLPGLQKIYGAYQDQPLVSISDDQRKPIPDATFAGTVYHGLPTHELKLNANKGKYLAFLGRLCPEKRPDRAIEIAIKSGVPLKIAAKVDPYDQKYYDEQIKPLMDHPLVEYIGEINEGQKAEFLGNAIATLFPIDWPEPFGLVMIESMACGTPLIAWPHGSVEEIVEDGLTGFHVRSVDEAVEKLKQIDSLPRERIRAEFDRRFTARRMAEDYLSLYQSRIDDYQEKPGKLGVPGITRTKPLSTADTDTPYKRLYDTNA